MNEPKLRFKADDGSQFPDWEEKKLGDITEKVVRKDANSNADVRMISQGNGFILQSNKYSRENAGQSLKKYTLLKRDEFAYNHGASKVKPYGVCYRLCESDEARVPYVYHTFKLIDGDSVFWNYSLNTSCMDRQLKKMVSSGARMDGLLNIGYDAYMSVNIHVPSLPEQQKIAEFLSTIDTVIEKQKETVSAWEERKKGMMQKLFSQEVRFKADDGSNFPEWEEKKLGECGRFYTGVGFSEKYQGHKGLDVDVYKVSDMNIVGNEKYMTLSNNTVDDSIVRQMKTKVITSKCLVFAKVGAAIYGERKRITTKPFLIDNNMMAFEPYSCLNIEYLHSWSCSVKFSQYAQVGALPSYNSSDIGIIKIHIPCLAEQQKIADCLSSLDEVIEKQKATLAAWEELKKGLLQQMFV